MIGDEIHSFAKELWPINRSLTGEGIRQTLAKIKTHIPELAVHCVPSGTDVFDWKVPQEWHVNDAYIMTPSGKKICDFKQNNLHLVGYSIPIRTKLSLADLQNHLYSLPEQPDAIPYITSYYKERWGFCISHDERQKLEDGVYEIVVDSKLFDGALNYGEVILQGQSDKEIFLSTYICHPSMANNELSGVVVTTYLVKWLMQQKNRYYRYRIVFIPETIGSITYISRNLSQMKQNIIAGFNVTCIGDERHYSYLPSRAGNTISDDIAKHVLKWVCPQFVNYGWNDRGSDERQYCSAGVDLPIASIMRTKYGEYPEYHTSLDNLSDVVTPQGLAGGYEALRLALELLERNDYFTANILCEPNMGKRGLYPTLSTKESGKSVRLMMNFLSYCDGKHSLLDIADKNHVPAWELYDIVDTLTEHGLITGKAR